MREGFDEELWRDYKKQASPVIGLILAADNYLKGETCLPLDLYHSLRRDLFQWYFFYQILSIGITLEAFKLGLEAFFFNSMIR